MYQTTLKHIVFALCSGGLLAGCTTAQYGVNYNGAQRAAEKARAANMEWRDTNSLLLKAREAAEKKDYETAIKLAKTARSQGEHALGQIKSNEEFLKQVRFYNPDATPEQDMKNLQKFFRWKFPKLTGEDFANGVYSLSKELRENWELIEEFPPYYPAIDRGEALWKAKFKNGKTWKDCFGDVAVAGEYPQWDKASGQVVTLPMAVNRCREKNGEKPFKIGKKGEDMLALTAYIAFESRGKPIHVVVPKDDPRALAAYNAGKKFYFSRRGYLNMACYQCHFTTSGEHLRANILSPALGQTSHFPVYRSKWGDMGSLHRRYQGCNKQVGAKPLKEQSAAYRNLEYFHTYLSNGIPLNGPGARF